MKISDLSSHERSLLILLKGKTFLLQIQHPVGMFLPLLVQAFRINFNDTRLSKNIIISSHVRKIIFRDNSSFYFIFLFSLSNHSLEETKRKWCSLETDVMFETISLLFLNGCMRNFWTTRTTTGSRTFVWLNDNTPAKKLSALSTLFIPAFFFFFFFFSNQREDSYKQRSFLYFPPPPSPQFHIE